MIKAIIVDKDISWASNIKSQLDLMKQIDHVDIYTTPMKAAEELKKSYADVAFLDVSYSSEDIMFFAKEIILASPGIHLIFVGETPEHALLGFELNAIDFFMKPITSTRLELAIKKIEDKMSFQKENTDTLYVKSVGSFSLLNEEKKNVIWLSSKARELFAFLYTHQGQVFDRETLIEILYSNSKISNKDDHFNRTLLEMRKTLMPHYGMNVVRNLEDGYMMVTEIKSDLDNIVILVEEGFDSFDDICTLQDIYHQSIFDFEDYRWAGPLRKKMHLKIRNAMIDFIERNKVTASEIEKVLIYLYQLDRYDEMIMTKLKSHYEKNGKKRELEFFKQQHLGFIKNETHITKLVY